MGGGEGYEQEYGKPNKAVISAVTGKIITATWAVSSQEMQDYFGASLLVGWLAG